MLAQSHSQAARQYALNHPVETTDTLYAIMQKAFLAGAQFASATSSSSAATLLPSHPMPQTNEPDIQPVYHRNGELACNRPAFYYYGPFNPKETADITKLRLLPDMRPATPRDVPRCGSCLFGIDPYSNADLDWQSLSDSSANRRSLLRETLLTPPAEPGADSPEPSPDSAGRTLVDDEGLLDVQPSAQPESGAKLQSLHKLATSLFDERQP